MRIETSKGSLPVRFSMNALRKISDKLNMSMNEIFELDLSVRPLNDMFVFMYEGFVDGARIDKEELKIADLDELGDIMTEDPKVLINCYKAFYEDMKNMSPKNEESKKK